jgi:hypothetical protein
VRKLCEVEVRIQFAVDPPKQIQIECGGHSKRVIIGTHDHSRVLLHVKANKESVVRVQHTANAAKEFKRLLLRKVSYIRTEKHQDLASITAISKRLKHLEVIAGMRPDA